MKAIKKNQAFRRRSAIEPLERRNLLAVDLVVEQVTDLPELVAGEQITYEIRVTNNGPDDAIGATISDPVTESLDDVTWERTVSFQQDADKLNGTNGYWAKASRFPWAISSVSSVGDLNADGFDDFAVGSMDGLGPNGERSAGSVHVIFGTNATVDQSVDLTSSVRERTEPKYLTLIGSQMNERIGFDLVPVGDINADGFDDLAVTVLPAFDAIPVTHILFGAKELNELSEDLVVSDLDGTNGFTLDAVMNLGEKGDVNGDGVDDLIMLNTDNASLDSGNLQVVFGPIELDSNGKLDLTNLTGENGFTITTREPSDPPFPMNAVAVNDTNGDGKSDILLHRAVANEIYVIYGGEPPASSHLSEMDESHGRLLLKEPDQWIRSAWSVGDINADGFEDLGIVASRPRTDRGDGYVVFGSSILPEVPFGLSTPSAGLLLLDGIDGSLTGNRTVTSVRGAGDTNGDGIDDLSIGVPILEVPNDLSPDPGTAYVLFGAPEIHASPAIDVQQMSSSGQGIVFQGDTPNDVVGRFSVGAGDINADGIGDLLVSGNGGVNVLFGDPQSTVAGIGNGDIQESIDVRVGSTITYTVSGTAKSDAAGRFVPRTMVNAPPGEIETDPPTNSILDVAPGMLVDLAVTLDGVPKELNPGEDVVYTLRVSNNGRDDAFDARIEHPLAMLEDATWTRHVEFGLDLEKLTPEAGTEINGADLFINNHHKVASLGDINGDGFDDIAYGTNQHSVIHVVLGSENIDAVDVFGDQPHVFDIRGDRLLHSVGYAGDFNGDGIDDFVLGSERGDTLATIVLGNTTFAEGNDVELQTLPGTFAILDSSVADGQATSSEVFVGSAGDINNDGMTDILVYTRNSIHVIFGLKSATSGTFDIADLNGGNGFSFVDLTETVPDWALPENRLFVAGGGDVNGDGVHDIVIARTHAKTWGDIHYFYGNPEVGGTGTRSITDSDASLEDSVNDLGQLQDLAGISVNGDANGDGLADVLLEGGYTSFGVIMNDVTGRPSFDNRVWYGTKNSTFSTSYRYRPKYVGDVDGNGYDDIGYVTGIGRDSGFFRPDFRAYAGLVFGGADFGRSSKYFEALDRSEGIVLNGNGPISSAGDLNGDGAHDFIMGDRIVFGHNLFAVGEGDISDSVDVPAGFAVTYSITGRVPDSPAASLLTASATPSERQVEFRPSDNSVERDTNKTQSSSAVIDAALADVDGNGEVDFLDFLVIAENFGESGTREEGDIDGNGTVDFLDFLFLARNFGRTRA